MTNEFSVGDYIDAKFNAQDWCVGRIIERDADIFKIRLDGMLSRNDLRLRYNSNRIAPFRKYSRGYTGNLKTFRDDPNLEFEKLEEVANLIEVFLRKNYSEFDPVLLNYNLRGRIFLFTDALLSKPNEDLSFDEIKDCFKYLSKLLGFAVIYLRGFPKLFAQFNEGLRNPDVLVTKNDVIFSHFIFELLESLNGIFGLMQRLSRLYDIRIDMGELTDLMTLYKENVSITTPVELTTKTEDSSENKQDPDASNQMSSEEIPVENIKTILANLMVNKFSAIGGFTALLNIIYPEASTLTVEERDEDTATESEASPIKRPNSADKARNGEKSTTLDTSVVSDNTMKVEKISKTYCPWIIIERILRLFELLNSRLEEEYKLEILVELKQRVSDRMKSIKDREIKELDIDVVKKVLDRLETLVTSLNNSQQTMEFYEFRERNELELYFRFLDGQSFEKKLRGLNGIREYASRVDVGSSQIDDAKAASKKTLIYFTPKEFVKWVLEKKVIEMIYEKYPHIELIKRSVDIQKFVAEYGETFPENLIDKIWNSSRDKHEDVVKAIYEKIIELGPYMKLEAAQLMYTKFLTVRVDDYNEDFIELISKFTQKCLRLVIAKTESGYLDISEVPENQKKYQFFGVPLMFELIMDETSLDTYLSQRVLVYLQEIISEFPAWNIFLPIAKDCLNNLVQDISVYQSLFILKEFLTTVEKVPAYEEICERYFETLAESHQITDYLVRNICLYWGKVRERITVLKNVTKKDIREEEIVDECLVGKFSHQKNVMERLNALRYFVAHSYLKNLLTPDQVRSLWQVFVLEPNFSFETTAFLKLIASLYPVSRQRSTMLIGLQDLREVLLEILCNENMTIISQFTLEKFNCLEFYFICVNIFEKKITQQDKDGDLVISGDYILTIDRNLTGLDFLWKCLVECPDGLLVDKFITLLVNIHTKLGPDLKEHAQELYQELVANIMSSIERLLEQRNIKAIERYIQFLGKFFDKLANKKSPEFYRSTIGPISNPNSIHAAHFQSQMQKVQVVAEYYPYGNTKNFEFYKKDKAGWIKETLARAFDIDSSDFELTIDDTLITEEDLIKELKDIILPGPGPLSIKMNKKEPRPVTEDPKYLITQNREYINILFRLFATIEPEKLKTVWDFTQKLPIQEDMKKEFFERRDFSDILDGDKALHNSNTFKLHYYLTIISDLYIADPYYLKIKNVDYNTVKSEWSNVFVNGNGVNSLITLIISTDFSHTNNFLWIKALLILYKVLRFFFITYPETQEFFSSEVFLKNLDVLFYASQYIGTGLGGDISFQYEVVRDHGHMCHTLCEIEQRILKADQRFYRDFLEYPNLRELFMIVFINHSLEKCDLYDPQIAYINLLNDVLEVLRTAPSPGKEIGNTLFKIVFEEMVFTALRSQYVAYYILKFIADTLSKYDLKKHFDCDLNIFNLMKELVEHIKSQEATVNNLQDIKEEACFYILQQYLQMNPTKIQYFGQDLGLVEEILAKGIFQVPSLDRKQGPKYTSKNVVKKAFDMLSMLSRNEKNFETVVNFLLPIHRMGIWRNFKMSSWALSANIKRRSYQYAGLKNLGCTCYMNSTLQQLFMIPTFRKYLPQLIDPTFNGEEADDNILFQLKRLFYGMTHVDKEYFSPKKFCLAFKDIDGSSTSFNEQKDAFEFFSLFMDRIEEQIKGTPHSDFIKTHFGGLLSNELLCKECPHSYDREEPFLAINLPVKNKKTITDSLGSFIEGEILDGDNAYYCEECKIKVKTVKRVSFKKLPNYLIFVLKRFEYDFDMNARVKVNDYCEFPQELNMEPFTQQYLKKMERPRKSTNDSMGIEISNSKTMGDYKASCEYDLKGVVIHLGIADSGHYYSVIKDTKTAEDGTKKDVWLEFNDTKVFEFNAKGLGDVGFGEKEGQHSYQSAYILVYERKNLGADLKKSEEEFEKYANFADIVHEPASSSHMEMEKNDRSPDLLVEEKAVTGEESGKMDVEKQEIVVKKDENVKDDDPRRFIPNIREEKQKFKEIEEELIRKNLRIFYITNIFSADYTKFVSTLIVNYEQLATSGISDYGTASAENNTTMENEGEDTQIEEEDTVRRIKAHGGGRPVYDDLFKFVCVVYFTTIIRVNDKKLQHNFFEWMCEKMDRDVRKCELVLNYFMNINFFTEMIFQCPHHEQRKFFVNLVKRAFKRVYDNEKMHKIFNKQTEDGEQVSCAANFLNITINFLEKSKVYLKTMPEYYWLFLVLMKIDEDVVNYLLTNQLLGRLGAIFYTNILEQEEIEEVMEMLPYYETDIDIEYNDEITIEPKKPKENDFYKHSLSDLTNLFSLMWELITYSFVSDREDHRNFPYFRPGIEYELNTIETKIYNLKKDQIEEMFFAISFENARARRAICKIIAFSSYNSLQNSRASLKYIQEELKEDKTNRRTDEYFKLITVLAKLDDSWAKRRNDILTDNVITALTGKTDNIQSVNIFAKFITRLIKSNLQVANIFRENTLKCDKAIKALRECITKQNQMAMPDQTARPTNYQVLEQTKKVIQRHVDFFEALKENEQPEERPNSDPGSEELEEYKYRRGQRIEFFDSTVSKWLKGVVENVYENMVKLKTTHPNGNVYYEWIEDDSSYLHSAEEPVAQEVNPNPEDTSPTQYCSSGDISFNQIDSPPSDRSREEMII